jgi:transcriptional regulator with XRE-family HTH domain
MILASNLKKYRFMRGFSQMKLAEKAETAPNYIAMIERGRKFPSDRLLEKVAEALGVNAVDLFSCQAEGIVTLHIELLKSLHQEILNDLTSFMVKRMEKLEEKSLNYERS